MSEIETLRAAVADETLCKAARRDAAAHVVRLLVEAVPEALETDDEVCGLQEPWPRSTQNEAQTADMWEACTNGRSVRGWNASDALSEVTDRHKLRTLLALIVNEAAPELERLAACEAVLKNHLHPEGFHRRNHYTPEQMLEMVRSSDDMKLTAKGRVPVARPPRSIQDLWV
jgi:hypothetical protein